MTKTLLKNPNPLNFFDCRKSKVPPPYFEYINIPLRYNLEDSISKWIYQHQKGRYYVGKSVGITEENSINTILKIGFEDPKELSYFTLACPLLKYK